MIEEGPNLSMFNPNLSLNVKKILLGSLLFSGTIHSKNSYQSGNNKSLDFDENFTST